jgi:hypothetical protein
LIKKRKRLERTALFVRRIVTFSINIAFLLAGWTAIVFVNLYDNEIQKYFEKFNWLKKIAAFIPSFILILINALIPFITKIITNLEKWDF